MRKYPEENPAYTCPECGAPILWEPECPGYPSDRGVMVCYPPCGNAIEVSCSRLGEEGGCDWWYRSPNRRGDAVRMGVRPVWMDEYERLFDLDEEREDE